MKLTPPSHVSTPTARYERAVRLAQTVVLVLTLLLGVLAPGGSTLLAPRVVAEGA
ncbi:MAG TPA: hypothetical protein VGG39_37090 [Polyangiaceae bacterium]|jgi:hypothetical protein